MERSVFQGLAVFRWVAWAWMATALALSIDGLARPALAIALVGVALGWTVAATVLWRRDPLLLARPVAALVELVIGASLLLLDGVVQEPGRVFATGQSLASVWPLTGVMSAGVVLGGWGGTGAGVALGVCRFVSTVLNDVPNYSEGQGLSLASTAVFYGAAGAMFGVVFDLLRKAREEVAEARAREEVARTLHDGVLQTLAIVERRASDPALARLAREQERELRAYLFGDRVAGSADLGAALRATASKFEDSFADTRAQVVVADDLPAVPPATVAALAGAVGEALTNAAKHGGAAHVVVYVEEDDSGGLFCSVRDDGAGFDPTATAEGVGLTRSIRGRLEEVGGRVEVASRPGDGTEIRLWSPVAS